MRYQFYDQLTRQASYIHDNLTVLHDVQASPFNPWSYTWLGRLSNATLETGIRITRRYEKLGFNIDAVSYQGKTFPVTERIVDEMPFCNLVHFKREGVSSDNKVLLVAPLSGHHATLLKGTVEALLEDHEVFITDWADAREVPVTDGTFSFDRYVTYLINYLEFLGEGTHMVAVCQPAVQALIATAVLSEQKHPCTPKSLTLMAGPIDTQQNPTRVNQFAQRYPMEWFRNFVIMAVPPGYPGEGRSVYPGFLQLGGFISMNVDTHAKKYLNFFQNLVAGKTEDTERFRAFYDEYLSVLDIPAEFYLETIERVFKNNELAEGKVTYHDRPVDFSTIKKTALLTVEGANDDIVGIGQTEAAHKICTKIPKTKRLHHVQEGAGHYGIFSGSKFQQHIRPLITHFINKHS